MRVLLNAVSIKEGGATVVLLKRLASLRQLRPEIEWIVVANSNARFAPTPDPMVTWVMNSWIDKSPLHAFAWYQFVLPAMIKKYRPDLVFSQTNFLPLHKLACPTVLLVQHAGYFSSEFTRLMREWKPSRSARLEWWLRMHWVRRSVSLATSVTVQTHALAQAIGACVKRPSSEMTIIPEGPGLAQQLHAPRLETRPDVFRIGYVTNWGVQKNFETLLRAAQILHDDGYRFKLVLTLSERDPRCGTLFAAAREMGIFDLIENHGFVGHDEISRIYDSLDIFAFPSLCESFGLPMIEAMARGLPIVVAAAPENIEMTRDAGLRFPPRDANVLASHLANLIENDAERIRRGELSLERSRYFTWEKTALETVRAFERAIGQTERVPVKSKRPKIIQAINFDKSKQKAQTEMRMPSELDCAVKPTAAFPKSPHGGETASTSPQASMVSNFQIGDYRPGKKS